MHDFLRIMYALRENVRSGKRLREYVRESYSRITSHPQMPYWNLFPTRPPRGTPIPHPIRLSLLPPNYFQPLRTQPRYPTPTSHPPSPSLHLAVEHLFSCPSLSQLRQTHNVSQNITVAFSNSELHISNTLLYLSTSNILPLIWSSPAIARNIFWLLLLLLLFPKFSIHTVSLQRTIGYYSPDANAQLHQASGKFTILPKTFSTCYIL